MIYKGLLWEGREKRVVLVKKYTWKEEDEGNWRQLLERYGEVSMFFSIQDFGNICSLVTEQTTQFYKSIVDQ